MRYGVPILDPVEFGRRVPSDALDPEEAAEQVLAEYLRGLEFIVSGRRPDGRTSAEARRFRFREVFPSWPDPSVEVPYPCASVSGGPIALERHSLVPTPIEESFGRYGAGTALWKLGEMVATFQVDAWLNTGPDREAVVARLPGAFAPGETADRVLLSGTPVYWSLPVRARLVSYERVDTPGARYSNERRVRCDVETSVDVVELRCATLLSGRAHLTVEEMVAIAETAGG